MLTTLKTVLHKSIKKWHRREHYPYQRQIAEAILEAVIQSGAGEQTFEIPVELPRQSGKTTSVVDVVELLLAASVRYLKRPLRIGIFAPQKEQATTDFDRLKDQVIEISKLGFRSKVATEGDLKIPEKWNSKTVKLYSRSGKKLGEVYIFPISKTSNPESKTLDLIIIEEAQDVDDDKMKNSIFPMGASTNAPRVYIGTAGTRLCYFKSQLDNNPRAVVIPLKRVFEERRAVAEATGDPSHLLYERFVQHEIEEHGEKSDYVQRQYFLVWKIGSGQFTVAAWLDILVGNFPITLENKESPELDEKGNPKKDRRTGKVIMGDALPCFVGIDTAKSPDQTVVTVVRENPALLPYLLQKIKSIPAEVVNELDDEYREIVEKFKDPGYTRGGSVGQLCGWLALKGTNYQDQFTIISEWLSHFENIKRIAIDATGQGDFMPDMFERHTAYNITRVKFGSESKDVLYKNLDQVIKNVLTLIPDDPMNANYREFRKEMIELEKEYKGRLLSVHHPEKDANGKAGHDDYADSWALAELAKTEHQKNEPNLRFL